MDSNQLAAVVGILLSLGFSYIPGLKVWFDGKSSDTKQAIMGLSLIVVAVSVFGLSCASVLHSVSCTREGAIGFASVLVSALVANQSIYLLTKKSN